MGLSFFGWNGMRVGSAAGCANGVVHLALAAVGALATRGLLGVAACLAAHGLVLEALFGVELLLTSGKHKFGAAVTAYENLVFEHFWMIPLEK